MSDSITQTLEGRQVSVTAVVNARHDRARHLRRGALAALREGRVVVLSAHTLARASRATAVTAQVLGHTGRHLVELHGGGWTCTCGVVSALCAHVVAVRLICRDVADLADAT